MKRNDIVDISEKIFFQNYENLFNVYGTEDGDYFYNITRKINIPPLVDSNFYIEYTVKPGDTWTLIAYDNYNDIKLWWLVCIANGIQNPLLFPAVGSVIKLLNTNTVQNILTAIRRA